MDTYSVGMLGQPRLLAGQGYNDGDGYIVSSYPRSLTEEPRGCTSALPTEEREGDRALRHIPRGSMQS